MKKRNMKRRADGNHKRYMREAQKSWALMDILRDELFRNGYKRVCFTQGYDDQKYDRYVWDTGVSLLRNGDDYFLPRIQGRETPTARGSVIALRKAVLDAGHLSLNK